MSWTRQNPSPRYRELLEQYQTMHQHGEQRLGIPASQTFDGRSLPEHAAIIKNYLTRHHSQTLLDYGAGKGMQYNLTNLRLANGETIPSIRDYWQTTVECYDPAYPPFQTYPEGQFDAVICTDVLEHCPEDDVPWILGELFSFARHFVYANIANYPASKHLPNGENAHCTQRPAEWWHQQFKQAALPGIAWYLSVDHVATTSNGQLQKVRQKIEEAAA